MNIQDLLHREPVLRFINENSLGSLLLAIIMLAVTYLTSKIVVRALDHYINKDSTPIASSSIFLNIARGFIWLIGISFILDICFHLNVSALFTALGVGGIALSLGFQDTISNFFGGLQLSVMKIIVPGDYIKLGSDEGVVQDVTWRHTTLKRPNDDLIYIPNSVLSKSSVSLQAQEVRLSFDYTFAQAHALSNESLYDKIDKTIDACVLKFLQEHACDIRYSKTISFNGFTQEAQTGHFSLCFTGDTTELSSQDKTRLTLSLVELIRELEREALHP